MTYDEFMALEDEKEKRALFESMDESQVLYTDMEAERDSFKGENEELVKKNEELQKELKKTKELNFTLARQSSRGSDGIKKDSETLLHEMFIGGKTT